MAHTDFEPCLVYSIEFRGKPVSGTFHSDVEAWSDYRIRFAEYLAGGDSKLTPEPVEGLDWTDDEAVVRVEMERKVCHCGLEHCIGPNKLLPEYVCAHQKPLYDSISRLTEELAEARENISLREDHDKATLHTSSTMLEHQPKTLSEMNEAEIRDFFEYGGEECTCYPCYVTRFILELLSRNQKEPS